MFNRLSKVIVILLAVGIAVTGGLAIFEVPIHSIFFFIISFAGVLFASSDLAGVFQKDKVSISLFYFGIVVVIGGLFIGLIDVESGDFSAFSNGTALVAVAIIVFTVGWKAILEGEKGE